MVIFYNVSWVIICIFNVAHCLREWPQSVIAASVNNVHQKLSSLESKAENEQEFLNNNYFTKLTILEVGSNENTTQAITDTTYDYNNLVLTTAIANKGDFTLGFKSTQDDAAIAKDNVREKYQRQYTTESEGSVQGNEYSVGELDSSETSSDETQFRVLTPARRIYNGHKTKIKHFPFLATIHVLRQFVCSGAIIKSDLVITAASCLKRWQVWLRRQTNKTTVDTTTEPLTTEATTTTTKKITTKITTTKPNTTDDLWTGNDNVNDTENISSISTKHVTSIEHETNTETDYHTTKADSSEEGDISSSYESTIAETTVTYETPPSEPKVGVLVVRVGTSYYRLEGRVLNVVKIYVHPSYREFNLQNNLVILRLGSHLLFKHRSVRTIAISTVAADVPVGTNVTIVGWGAKTYHNKVFNALWNLIHKSVLTVSSPYDCIKTYTSRFVGSTNFCAVNARHEGACNCDEGVPAVVDGVLVGLVSFGSPKCGPPGDPTVFTNLGYYNEWISEIMAIEPASNSSESSSDERNKTTIKQTASLRNRLAYHNKHYQEKLNNFRMKMARQFRARGYRRYEDEDLRETLNTLSHKKAEENFDTENEMGLLTTLPMRRRHKSDYPSSGPNEKIENHFLLTPNTAGTVYNTLVNAK